MIPHLDAQAQTTLVLVYQGGLANIVEISDKGQKRILQASFLECEWFMRGAQHAGACVDVAGCNMAGDILDKAWTRDLDSLPNGMTGPTRGRFFCWAATSISDTDGSCRLSVNGLCNRK
jgi:hypothetical protein